MARVFVPEREARKKCEIIGFVWARARGGSWLQPASSCGADHLERRVAAAERDLVTLRYQEAGALAVEPPPAWSA